MIKTTSGLAMAALLMALAMPVLAANEPKPSKPAKTQTNVKQQGARGKIQCWTDAQGSRVCGDSVPPEYAKQEINVMDKQGRVVDTRSREKTAEELAAEQKAAEEAAALKLKTEKQAAYDKYLTDSYSSVKDLERARNERLATLDGRINLANQAVAGSDKVKADLQARIDGLLKKGRPVDLQQRQLREADKNLRDNRAAINQMQKDREHVCSDFLRDIRRYQELTMGSSAYASECPVPGSPALALAVERPKPPTAKKKTDKDKKDAKKDPKKKDTKKKDEKAKKPVE
ncbi:hypothetical protein [Solimonas sp. SE-A11]|uniref:hypothetical protein n=1 Tax=Solimonas sp. SE-A11 TaxID=3054954 RepID=UPI00259CB259|nr:hypothetical protein [Solimonas sp. SE-A11]MDM4772982.1 hypothetical protein [Solimonas sp. SE-A11]